MTYNSDYKDYVKKLRGDWGSTFKSNTTASTPSFAPPKFLQPPDPSVFMPPLPPLPPTPEELVAELGEPPKTQKEFQKRMTDIMFGSKQETLVDAITADGYDALIGCLPVVGDLFGLTRVADAQSKGNSKAMALQSTDVILGSTSEILAPALALMGPAGAAVGLAVGAVGNVIDALFMANTLSYVWDMQDKKKGK